MYLRGPVSRNPLRICPKTSLFEGSKDLVNLVWHEMPFFFFTVLFFPSFKFSQHEKWNRINILK